MSRRHAEGRRMQAFEVARRERKRLLPLQCAIFLSIILLVVGFYKAGFDSVFSFSEAPAFAYNEEASGRPRMLLSSSDCCGANCTEEEHSGEFPDDIFSEEERKDGAILLHTFGMILMFLGLAIVCDDYFEGSLKKISQALNLSPDVAGATFMAAGSSAPELFTSIMGVFFAESDVGIGTIVGSAVFNILVIIGLCCFVAEDAKLSWYPLTRDTIFYCISIVALVASILDQEIQWYEALILFLAYFLYIYVMKVNQRLKVKVMTAADTPFVPTKGQNTVQKVCEHWMFNWFIYSAIIANIVIVVLDLTDPEDWQKIVNNCFSGVFIAEMILKHYGYGFFGYWTESLNAFDGILVFMIILEFTLSGSGMAGGVRGLRLFRFFRALRGLRIVRLYRAFNKEYVEAHTQTDMEDLRLESFQNLIDLGQDAKSRFGDDTPAEHESLMKDHDRGTSEDEDVEDSKDQDGDKDEDEEEDEDDGADNPWEGPDEKASRLSLFLFYLSWPLSVAMWHTIPNANNNFVGTFVMSIVWIAIFSYIMVWMATVLGETVGIPTPVMGLTLLAAGTSIPDALSSMSTARKGFADMAVSNSIGSNVFDILIGLAFPWAVKTCIVSIGETVPIESDALTLMVFTLFLTVALVVLGINFVGWRLKFKLGVVLMVSYGIFIAESLLLEYGVIIDNDDDCE